MKEKVYQSSEKIIRLASECLDRHPSLQKVVIVKRPPRYDSRINAYLSEFANDVLDDLWLRMGSPHKIVIGKQELECEGELRFQRFGNPNFANYDGIHMRGKLALQHMTMTYINMLTGLFPHLKKHVKPTQKNQYNQSGN